MEAVSTPYIGVAVWTQPLYGYADIYYPDRSALIFALNQGSGEGDLLQVREIRGPHLEAGMVTLSVCNTRVGPAG